jgi:hypothetical protein
MNSILAIFHDRPVVMKHIGCGSTALHVQIHDDLVIEPVKTGERAARWTMAEILITQRAIIAGCTRGQRIAVTQYLRESRKSIKTAEAIFDDGMQLIAGFVEINDSRAA